MTSDISSLCCLLARIPPVGTIVLGLPEYIEYPQTIRNIERWARAFLKLLDTIAKSGCRDLRLLDPISHLPKLSNNLYVATPPPAKPNGTKSRGTRNSAGFRSAHHHLTGMSTIKILSLRLFQPFFIGWIIDMLEANRESLVCVHFNVTSIDPVLLLRVFGSMNLPAVKELHISSLFHIWVDLCSFLNRHLSITSLRLDGILPFKDPQMPDPPIVLPFLTQLTAMSPMVTLLLRHQNRVPLFFSIHVSLHWNDEDELDPQPLAAVATHTHISSLQLSNSQAGDMCSMLERHLREVRHTQTITPLGHIRSVNLNQPNNCSNFSLTVKRWLYLFPHLEHASLSFRL